MKQTARFFAAAWLLASCGQELALPSSSGQAGTPSSEAPSLGVTGAAGDAADGATGGRLNVPSGEGLSIPVAGEAGESAGGAAGEGNPGGRSGNAGGAPRGGGSGGTAGDASGGEAGSGTAGAAPMGPRQVFFSEYVEGEGKHKALEIFALSSASLAGCDLETYFNGGAQPGRIALQAEIEGRSTYVLCSSALAEQAPALCQRSTNLTFNGDDAIALRCDGQLIDVIGQIGVDPGAAWGDGATADHALRRRCTAQRGRTEGSMPFDPAQDWAVADTELLADLGRYTCDAPQ